MTPIFGEYAHGRALTPCSCKTFAGPTHQPILLEVYNFIYVYHCQKEGGAVVRVLKVLGVPAARQLVHRIIKISLRSTSCKWAHNSFHTWEGKNNKDRGHGPTSAIPLVVQVGPIAVTTPTPPMGISGGFSIEIHQFHTSQSQILYSFTQELITLRVMNGKGRKPSEDLTFTA